MRRSSRRFWPLSWRRARNRWLSPIESSAARMKKASTIPMGSRARSVRIGRAGTAGLTSEFTEVVGTREDLQVSQSLGRHIDLLPLAGNDFLANLLWRDASLRLLVGKNGFVAADRALFTVGIDEAIEQAAMTGELIARAIARQLIEDGAVLARELVDALYFRFGGVQLRVLRLGQGPGWRFAVVSRNSLFGCGNCDGGRH